MTHFERGYRTFEPRSKYSELGWRVTFHLFLQLSISTVAATKSRTSTRQKQWDVTISPALPVDKKRNKDVEDIVIMYNGGTFYTPLIPIHLAEGIRALGQLGNVLGGLVELSTSILNILPQGLLKEIYSKLPLVSTKLLDVVQSTDMGSGSCKGRFVEESAPQQSRKRPVPTEVHLISDEDQAEAEVEHIVPGDTKKPDSTCFCGVKCKNVDNLTKHIEKKHPVSNDWNCSKCDLNVASQSAMWKHFRSKHLNIFLFKCSVCDKMSSDEKSAVAYHLHDKHNLTVPELITCPNFCDKKYLATKSSLKRHLAICTAVAGDKPFPCPDKECDKTFRSKEMLSVHQKSHHPKEGEAAIWYICTTCTTATEIVKFQQAASYAKHMQSFHNVVPPKRRK